MDQRRTICKILFMQFSFQLQFTGRHETNRKFVPRVPGARVGVFTFGRAKYVQDLGNADALVIHSFYKTFFATASSQFCAQSSQLLVDGQRGRQPSQPSQPLSATQLLCIATINYRTAFAMQSQSNASRISSSRPPTHYDKPLIRISPV